MTTSRGFSELPRSRAWITILLLAASAALGQGCATAPAHRTGYTFFPAPPDTARFQFLGRIETSSDVREQSWFSRLVLGRKPRLRLGKPYGVTVTGSRIWVADTQLKVVVRIDLAERDMRAFSSAGTVRFSSVINLDHDERGNVYVADPEGGQVVVMDPEGRLVATVRREEGMAPIDVGVGQQELYVVDRESRKVHVFDRVTSESLGTLDTSADSIGVGFPTNVAVAPDGTIYVVDTLGCRVLRFDEDRSYLGAIGRQGFFPGTFARPKGAAVDPHGLLLVVDAAFENLQIFRPDGQALTYLGGPGEAPGNLWLPAGVAVGPDLAPYLAGKAHPAAEIDYVVVVASQFGPARLDFFGRIGNTEAFARACPPGGLPVPGSLPGLLPAGELPPDVTGATLGEPEADGPDPEDRAGG